MREGGRGGREDERKEGGTEKGYGRGREGSGRTREG